MNRFSMYKPIEHSSRYYFNEDTYVNMQMQHKHFKFILTLEYKTLRCLIYLQTKMVAHHSTDATDSYVRNLWILKVGVTSHFYILINFMVITNVYVRHFIDMEVSSVIFLRFHVKLTIFFTIEENWSYHNVQIKMSIIS